ncbi:MAG TPA: RsmD family RNA methyltransferase [Candidatus Saccharimonadia bacterium]|nr:RsmD family RNA methyltransferase [Candidatus Saccharimonadia bacterium]
MRILGGELRGRAFEQPKTSAVRPLSDKVRAAIFDVAGVPMGGVVLDVYAGSGAAGFEALSRGAAMVEAIETNPRVVRLIEANAAALGLHWGYLLHALKLETWLALPGNQPSADRPQSRYNLIIADPPYARLDAELLERLVPFLRPEGALVVSHSSKYRAPELAGASLAKHKVYGDTALSFYTLA